MYVILDNYDLFTIIPFGMCHITYCSMFEQSYIQSIDSILNLPEKELLTKRSLIQLQRIKNEITGERDKECFCSMVRRKVWIKDFVKWYEGAN